MSEAKKRGRPKGSRPPKKQWPLKLDEETAQRLAAAAYWCRRSANSIVEEGLRHLLAKLEAEHNGGEPFAAKPEAANVK